MRELVLILLPKKINILTCRKCYISKKGIKFPSIKKFITLSDKGNREYVKTNPLFYRVKVGIHNEGGETNNKLNGGNKMAVKIPSTTSTWTVFSMKVAVKLRGLGHELIKYKPNFADLTKKVFIFRVNETFERDINLCIEEVKREKQGE